MRRALLLLAALAALAAPAATAAGDPLTDALAKTSAQSSYRFTFTGGVQAAGQSLRFTATGSSDTRAGRTQMRMDLSQIARLLGPAAGRAADWRVDVVLAGTRSAYLRFPFLTRLYASSKPWVKVDLSKTGNVSGLDVGQFTQADPAQQLALLRASTGQVQEIGKQTIGGTKTTHYRAAIDYGRYARIAPPAQRAAARRLLGQLVVRKVPVDVWVDGDGLVRRMAMRVPLKQGSTTLVMDVFDYGTKVAVALPPAAQTVDLQTLTKKKGR